MDIECNCWTCDLWYDALEKEIDIMAYYVVKNSCGNRGKSFPWKPLVICSLWGSFLGVDSRKIVATSDSSADSVHYFLDFGESIAKSKSIYTTSRLRKLK